MALSPEFERVEATHDLDEARRLFPEGPDVILYENFQCIGDVTVAAIPDCLTAFPQSRVVVLGQSSGEMQLVAALKWGAMGYVSKSDDPDSIIERVLQASRGELALDAGSSQIILQHVQDISRASHEWQTQPIVGAVEPLSGRELEVLRLLAEGMTNRQIGMALGIAESTVKNHLHSLFKKLGADSRTRALSEAVRRGILVV